MAKCGRRPVLDEIKRREILAILAVGGSRRVAAKYVGCAVSTIQNTADRDPQFAAQLHRMEYQSDHFHNPVLLPVFLQQKFYQLHEGLKINTRVQYVSG